MRSDGEARALLKSLSKEDLPVLNTISQRILRKSAFIELNEDQK